MGLRLGLRSEAERSDDSVGALWIESLALTAKHHHGGNLFLGAGAWVASPMQVRLGGEWRMVCPHAYLACDCNRLVTQDPKEGHHSSGNRSKLHSVSDLESGTLVTQFTSSLSILYVHT